MEVRKDLIKLDEPTKEIHVYGAPVVRCKQDKLGRVYITIGK